MLKNYIFASQYKLFLDKNISAMAIEKNRFSDSTLQYSPVLLGTIADELPDTGGREAHWFTIDEFEAQPRRPISDPLLAILRASDSGALPAPVAVWLPA